MVQRLDLDLKLEHPKAPLNIDQRLVAANNVLGSQIGCIGHQQKFGIHQARMCQGFVIYPVAKQFTFEVHLHNARQMGHAHLMIETRSCAPKKQLATPGQSTRIQRPSTCRTKKGLSTQRLDHLVALGTGLVRHLRVLRHHQPKLTSHQLRDYLFAGIAALVLQGREQFKKLALASAGTDTL